MVAKIETKKYFCTLVKGQRGGQREGKEDH